MINIGKTINRFRLDSSLSQYKLAEAVGITPSYLSSIENERYEPSVSLLEKICKELGIPKEVFFWEALEIPDKLSPQDRKICEMAKVIVKAYFRERKQK